MRRLSAAEEDRLRATLEPLDRDAPARWKAGGSELWTDDAQPVKVFLLAPNLVKALEGTVQDPAPTSAGILVGHWERNTFLPSLEGAYELGRRSRAPRVRLKPKGVQLFLYGRDVLSESIASADAGLHSGGLALVANLDGDVVGLARIVAPLGARGRVLEPILDRGWYLREGG